MTRLVSVGTYNLHLYGFHDRTGDGQRTNPKPETERQAVADVITRMHCDILAIQEIGHRAVLEGLLADLRRRGVEYPHVEFLQRGDSELNLALLSRFPIIATRPRLLDTYTIGGESRLVARGFIDVDVDIGAKRPLRVFVAHLKSRAFHPLGQTEMRRNEARLLSNHVRQALRENPDAWVVVAGDLNDSPRSAPLRLLLGDPAAPLLHDLRPQDDAGGVWTWEDRENDEYARLDYVLVSSALRRCTVGEVRIERDSPASLASDHRPVVARFQIRPMP